jgi:hypothetical protein
MKYFKLFENFLSESKVNEELGGEFNVSGISRSNLQKILNTLSDADISYDFNGSAEMLSFDSTELDKGQFQTLKKLGLTLESAMNERSDLNELRKPKAEDLVHDMKVKITKGRFAGSKGVIHDFQLTDDGKLVDGQVSILVDKPGKPFTYLGLDDILIESVNESKISLEKLKLVNSISIQGNPNKHFEAEFGKDIEIPAYPKEGDVTFKKKKIGFISNWNGLVISDMAWIKDNIDKLQNIVKKTGLWYNF